MPDIALSVQAAPSTPPCFDLDPSVADDVDLHLSAGFGASGLDDGLGGDSQR